MTDLLLPLVEATLSGPLRERDRRLTCGAGPAIERRELQ
jgi:hypothetical protein